MMCLQAWYSDQCDGDWEHELGVEIGTIDNPGWRLAIDLTGTPVAGNVLERSITERSSEDWIHYWSDGVKFEAACGVMNLLEAVEAFCRYSTQTSDPRISC
jgi:Immunity protein 53